MAASADGRAWRALSHHLWPAGGAGLKLRLAIIFAMSLVSSSLAAIAPLFLRGLIGALSSHSLRVVPVLLALAYPALRFAGLAIIQARVILTAAVMEGVKARFAVSSLSHILRLGRGFHLDRSTGALARILDRGAAGLETSIRSTHVVVFQVLLEATLVCVVLARVISPAFGLILAAVMAGYAAMAIGVTRLQVAERRKRNALDNAASSLAFEALSNWDLVRAFGRERFETGRFEAARMALARVAVRVQAATSSMSVGWQAMEAVATTTILSLAAAAVIAGHMRLGDLVLAQVYMLQVFANMMGLGLVYNDARQGFTDLGELQAILDQPAQIPLEITGAPGLAAGRGEVTFEGVSFAYRPDAAALDDVSLTIPPGRTLALVGASGAGKTTCARLLMRLYEPDAGRVLIDGQDLRAFSHASLTAAVGVVSQDTQLFNETLAYNIRYGRLDASDAEVAEAARLAALAGFIESLPLGYATPIGERGLKLSGGERQRLAIARLFLARPPICIFDESTSSVDSLTEAAIQASLRGVAAGRTTLIIAHRLSTVTDADEIAVIERGRVAERGTHGELLALGGMYAGLWERQARMERASA